MSPRPHPRRTGRIGCGHPEGPVRAVWKVVPGVPVTTPEEDGDQPGGRVRSHLPHGPGESVPTLLNSSGSFGGRRGWVCRVKRTTTKSGDLIHDW